MSEPYVVAQAYIPRTEPGMHHWRIRLGGMQQLCIAVSHQAAKRVALAYWDLHGEHFAKTLRARIAERWRGGLKARRENRNLGASPDARWYPPTSTGDK